MTRARNIANPTQITIPLDVTANITSNAVISVGNSTVNTSILSTGITANGASITSINANNISSGTLDTTRLPATVVVSDVINVASNTFFVNSSAVVVQAEENHLRLQGVSNTNKNVSIFYNESGDYGQINCDESGVNQKDLWITGLNLKFGRNTSLERIRIDSNGNVLVGSTSQAPVVGSGKYISLYNLSNATISVQAVDSVNDRNATLELLSSGNGGSTSDIVFGDTDTTPGSPSPLRFLGRHSGSTTERMRIDSNGNVIVQTSGSIGLSEGTTSAWKLQSDGANGYLRFFDSYNNTERVRIDSSGHFYSNYSGAGNFYSRAGSAYATLADMSAYTAPIQVQETATGTTDGRWIPMISGRSVSSQGYRQHVVFGSYRGAVWGNAVIAVGGNDQYPTTAFYFDYVGNFTASGTKNFRIDHPLESKANTHYLVHAAVEAPQADLIYRGKAILENGQAEINIDDVARMTEGTFGILTKNIQVFTTNETDWTPVKGSVSNNILTIIAQDETSNASVSWLVIAERDDQNMYINNEEGRLEVEPLKEPIFTANTN